MMEGSRNINQVLQQEGEKADKVKMNFKNLSKFWTIQI